MPEKRKQIVFPKVQALLAGAFILLLYLSALFMPETLWGLHYPAFLPAIGKGLLFGLAIILVLSPAFIDWDKIFHSPEGGKWGNWTRGLPYGPALLMGLLFWNFPIASDSYGDAREIFNNLNGEVEVFDPGMLKQSLLPVFDLKTGTISFYAIVSLFGYLFSANLVDTLFALEAVLGMLFVLLWLRLVQVEMKTLAGRVIMGVTGLSTPALQIYFGHVEIYAFPLSFNLAFLTALVLFFRTQKSLYFWMLLPLFYLCVKFSITGILLAPVLGLAVLYYGRSRGKGKLEFWTWKQLFYRILIPGMLVGVLVYVFVTKSVFGERFFVELTTNNVIFLPIQAVDEAPLDHYNLFSLAHLLDYANMWFLWSAPALLIGGLSLSIFRKSIDWSDPLLKTLSIGFIVYFLFFFVLNPLLGMQNDWDLMSLPVPVLLASTLVLAGQLERLRVLNALFGALLGLALLSCSTFWVNADLPLLSNRLDVVGSHNFKTYYMGSITSWKCALDAEPDPDVRIRRIEILLEGNKAHTTPGRDPEYAYLHWRLGEIWQKEKQGLSRAIGHFEQARDYAPFYGINLNSLVGACFYQGDFAKADRYAEDMIAYPYPDLPTALRAGVQVALEAKNWERALARTEKFLQIAPQDQRYKEIRRRLTAREDLESIKALLK